MIADVDIWRTANMLMKQHGDDAVLVASQRADALLAGADLDGFLVFVAIVKAINQLQRATPSAWERVN